MAVAKCVTVSGRSRGQFSTYLQRREAVWPSFCAHAELERWPAAGPLARKRRRALVERLLARCQMPRGTSSKHACIAVARGPVLWPAAGAGGIDGRRAAPAAACQRALTAPRVGAGRRAAEPRHTPQTTHMPDREQHTHSEITHPETQARAARRGRARARRARRAGAARDDWR